MFLLIFMVVVIVVYVNTFKEEFTAEHIEKITPLLVLVTSLIIILGILGSVLGR